jgi:hypothetical protein
MYSSSEYTLCANMLGTVHCLKQGGPTFSSVGQKVFYIDSKGQENPPDIYIFK